MYGDVIEVIKPHKNTHTTMSHHLEEKDTMFSGSNTVPWHGLDTVIVGVCNLHADLVAAIKEAQAALLHNGIDTGTLPGMSQRIRSVLARAKELETVPPVKNHTYTVTKPVTVAAINKAIRYMGIKLVAGKGYYYFRNRTTGAQVGASVIVYRASHQPLAHWITDAEDAVDQDRAARREREVAS